MFLNSAWEATVHFCTLLKLKTEKIDEAMTDLCGHVF